MCYSSDIDNANGERKMATAHQLNIEAAQREINQRASEGEDMTGAWVCQKTYAIKKPAHHYIAAGCTKSFVDGVARWVFPSGVVGPAV